MKSFWAPVRVGVQRRSRLECAAGGLGAKRNMERRERFLPDVENVCTAYCLDEDFFDLTYASKSSPREGIIHAPLDEELIIYAQLCFFISASGRCSVCRYGDKSIGMVPPFRRQRGQTGLFFVLFTPSPFGPGSILGVSMHMIGDYGYALMAHKWM